MKIRRLAISLMLAVCLMSSACALAEDSLLLHAEEMAAKLDMLSASKTYVTLLSGSEEINNLLAEWSAAPHETPTAAYRVAVTEEHVNTLLSAAEEDPSAIPDAIRPELVKRLVNAAAPLINARAGVATLAASSVLTATTAFVDETVTEASIYILEYADAMPVIVSFCPAEDGAVMASASYLVLDALEDTADIALLRQTLEDAFGEITVEEISVTD